MTEFTIGYTLNSQDSLNKIYAGIHWSKRKAYADLFKMVVRNALKRTAVGCYQEPVEVEMKFNTGIDIDNCGLAQKLIIDGMKGILIRDDSPKCVRKVSMEHWDGEGILVRVRECA